TVTEPASTAEELTVCGTQRGAACARVASVRPSAVNSPTMSTRMASIDPREDRRVDRRTLLRRGLAASAALLGGAFGIRAAAEAGEQQGQTSARARPRPGAGTTGGPRREHRP